MYLSTIIESVHNSAVQSMDLKHAPFCAVFTAKVSALDSGLGTDADFACATRALARNIQTS